MIKDQRNTRRRSAGMSVVELIIALCILGILAAVGIPTYTRYVQQAKVISSVIPVIYLVETSITIHHSLNHEMPNQEEFQQMLNEIDTRLLSIEFSDGVLTATLAVPAGEEPLLAKLNGSQLIAEPRFADDRIVAWNLGGPIAEDLDVSY